jgi:hypothetical protein
MARSTMAALISRVRLLINDVLPANSGQVWTDNQIQDVMDATRLTYRYLALAPAPTYTASTINYFDYYADLTDWEDDVAFFQWRINTVTPATAENIPGHWVFATTTLPPVYLVGKTYDVYRSAADLLERQAAQWTLAYTISVDGQNLQRGNVITALQTLAQTYRQKQRIGQHKITRTDLSDKAGNTQLGLGPLPIDYMGSGDGR